MDLIVTGVVAGWLGTFAMDSLNHLFARVGILLRTDVGMIGRMSAGWASPFHSLSVGISYLEDRRHRFGYGLCGCACVSIGYCTGHIKEPRSMRSTAARQNLRGMRSLFRFNKNH